MEEAVYVIRLTKDSTSDFGGGGELAIDLDSGGGGGESVLPSEQRYSATLVLGLGTVHVGLGVVSAALAVLALFVETEVNQYASGLWAGIVYIGCGITGILAYSRWYIKRQILWFLFGSLLSTVAALACVALTSCGLHWKRNALEERQSLAAFRKYYALLDGDEESASTGYAVTVNIYLAAVAEAAWSAFSIKVAFEGARAPEYDFSSSEAVRTESTNFSSISGGDKRVRRELVLSANLPPGYSPGHLLCHLTDPATNQFHVARANPLASEVDSDDDSVSCRPPPAIQQRTMTREDRVNMFLREAIRIANENASKAPPSNAMQLGSHY